MHFRLPLLLVLFLSLAAANGLKAQEGFRLHYHLTGKDTTISAGIPALETNFRSAADCREYLNGLPQALRRKGYLTVSVDSIHLDSLRGDVWVFIGEAYHWRTLTVGVGDRKILEAAGWELKADSGSLADFGRVERNSEKFIAYMENHGYPFARIWLDSMQIEGQGVSARIAIDKGPLYKIDSIRVTSGAKIKNSFLQRYLDIPAGGPYRKDRLDAVSRRILELPYVREARPWDMTMVGTGSTLNLYLEPKRQAR